MRFVVTNFWPRPQALRRRNLSHVRNPKPGSSQSIASPIAELPPLAYGDNMVDSHEHLSANDSTTSRKTA